jgi:hypothetical protein
MFGRSKKLANESFYDAEEDSVLDGAEEEEEEEYYHNPPPQSRHKAVTHGNHPPTHRKKNWFHIPNLLGGRKHDDEESVDSLEDQSIAVPASEEEQAMLYLAQEASKAEFHRKQEMRTREGEEIRRVMQESVLEEQNRRQHAANNPPQQVPPHHGPPAGSHYADPRGISPHEAEQLRYIQQMHQHQQPHHVSSPHGHEDHHHHPETGLEHHVQQMNLHRDSAGHHHHHHHSSVGARDDPAGLQAAMAILMLAQRHFDHDPSLTSIEAQRRAWELTREWLAQASAQLQLASRKSHLGAVPAPAPAPAAAIAALQQHRQPVPHSEDVEWECPACTLMNQATFLTCAACGHPRR